MFSDPMVALMAMLILCFSGILVMFIFVVRALSAQAGEMRESFHKQQLLLADLESQFMEMSFQLRRVQDGGGAAPASRPVAGKSTADVPLLRQDDDLMSMLEATMRKKASGLDIASDGLLPPPAVARPLVEEYDPAKDPHLFDDSFLPKAAQTARVPKPDSSTSRTGVVGGKGRAALSLNLDD